MIEIYTDGSCYAKERSGGWAFHMTYGNQEATRYGYKRDTTNNEMELTAIHNALSYIPLPALKHTPVKVYTDSQYCINAIHPTKGWAIKWRENNWITSSGSKVSNRNLVERLHSLCSLIHKRTSIELVWVKGHSGLPLNEFVDAEANKARVNKITNWK